MKENLGNFDLEGVNHFLKILDKLELNKTPTEEEWNDLFATRGYEALITHEFSRDFFIDNFRRAFMPSMSSELKDALENDSNRVYLEHYMRVSKLRDPIVKHLETMDYTLVSKTALDAAREFLPSIAMSRVIETPTVAFVIFMNDARGGYGPVIMDALSSMEWGDISLFLGHELHHFYRNRLPFALNFIESDSVESCLVNILVSIESEGVADLINMDQQDRSRSWHQRKEKYDHLVELVPDSIRFLDSWIIQNSRSLSEINESECRKISTKITNSGHQMGYYMAKAITNRFTTDRLIATVGKPFAFIRLYQNAVDEEGSLPGLSPKSWEVLLNLEEKYSIKEY